MKILAFESSCDETAVAVVEDGRRVLSDAIASQADLHALYGGVVPELASRKHVEVIAALTEKALADAGCTRQDIDAVAVTYAPGLIGAVLVGLSFAKSVAYGLGVPLIPVHHVRGHIAANYLAFPELEPPFLALAISGGNTMIVDVRDYTDLEILGATRDDAAGECFDKAARVLGLPYPGGAPMDKLAQQSRGGVYTLPHSHVEGAPLDMSFSGLKTAVVNLAHHAEQVGEPLDAPALARDFAQAVSDTLVPRAMEAAKQCRTHRDCRRRRRGGQLRHPGGPGAGLRKSRLPAVSAAAAVVRRQRCHDRRTGVLRISGGPYGGHGPERLRYPRHQRINDTGGHRTAGVFYRYMEKRRGSAAALLHYLRERIREEKGKEKKNQS